MRKALKVLWFCFKLFCFFLLSVLLIVVGADVYTNAISSGYCHKNTADCRQGDVGLVLGCSKRLSKNRANAYFTGRMQAAAELWKSGKLRCIIVSGDNREKYYNEPRDMKNALVKLGVPEDRIICDFAGLRTYDSVVRAQRIFGADKITIISQSYHVKRAVATARHMGIDAHGYCAAHIPFNRPTLLRQFLRERAARVAMMFDLIIGTEPRHMGERIALPE
jgi:SanA protein